MIELPLDKESINILLSEKRYDEIKKSLLAQKEITQQDNDLSTLCYLCTIYEKEKKAGQVTVFSKVSNVDELLERYARLKFYLRRIDFDVISKNEMEDFYRFFAAEQISSYELLTVIEFSVFHKEKVLQIVKGERPLKAENENNEGKFFKPEAISDENTICFILCTNDRLYAEECLYYIHHLHIPDGYQIDVLTVEEAESMTAGYNEAMRYSKAKYKVYLHHDTYLIYRNFIHDILNIFQSDSQIGMIGVIGAPKIPENGIMWDAKRYGMIYEQHIYETVMLSNKCSQPLEEVEAVDGLLMITQYDIPWREDLFDKWDFYDCSQSMEFIRHGYKVVVPEMEEPWCVHDCGFLNLENYDEEREKFVKEYLI